MTHSVDVSHMYDVPTKSETKAWYWLTSVVWGHTLSTAEPCFGAFVQGDQTATWWVNISSLLTAWRRQWYVHIRMDTYVPSSNACANMKTY